MADGLRFTNEEFRRMLRDLLDPRGSSYDTMCAIVYKTLGKFVYKKCDQYEIQNQWEDILQDIQLKAVKNVMRGFLRRKGLNVINDDPVWFQSWLFTIAKNEIKSKYSKAVEEQKVVFDPSFLNDEELKDIEIEDPVNPYATVDHVADLKKSVRIVLEDDASIYIRLAWFAWSIYYFDMKCDEHKISEKIVKTFERKTLNEMYSMILKASEKIEWLVIDEEHNKKVVDKLDARGRGGKTMGESMFNEFFMKTGGKVSVNNWTKRVNDTIKAKFPEGEI